MGKETRVACPTPVLNSVGNGGCDLQPPPDAALPKPKPTWTCCPPLALPAPIHSSQRLHPPVKGPKHIFDVQVTKAMTKARKKSPTIKSKKINIPPHIQNEWVQFRWTGSQDIQLCTEAFPRGQSRMLQKQLEDHRKASWTLNLLLLLCLLHFYIFLFYSMKSKLNSTNEATWAFLFPIYNGVYI